MTDELRALAAEQAGLPPEAASRLHGETMTELADDAKRFAEQLGVKPPPPPVSPLDQWKALAKSDPERFCDLTDGDVDFSQPPPDGASLTPEADAARARRKAAWDSREYLRRELGRGGNGRDALRELARTNPTEFNRRMDAGEITEDMLRR